MKLLFISLILIYIYFVVTKKTINNYDYCKKYCHNMKLFNLLYENLFETSIKHDIINDTINTQRYTIPVNKKRLELNYIIKKMSYPKIVKNFVNKYSDSDDDIIFGLDDIKKCHKIYVDKYDNDVIHCLEIPYNNSNQVNNKIYKKTTKLNALSYIYKLKYRDLFLNKIPLKKWDLVLTKQDDSVSNEICGFHISLKKPQKLKEIAIFDNILLEKFKNDNIYWVSVTDRDITYYTRPTC